MSCVDAVLSIAPRSPRTTKKTTVRPNVEDCIDLREVTRRFSPLAGTTIMNAPTAASASRDQLKAADHTLDQRPADTTSGRLAPEIRCHNAMLLMYVRQ